MNIGLLTYGLDRPMTGIGRYTVELAKALRCREGSQEVILLLAGGAGPLEGQGFRSVSLPGCRLLPALLTLGNIWIPSIADRLNLDIVHDPIGIAPFLFGAGRARIVVTLHDVFSWSHPGTSTLLENLVCRLWLPRMIGKARAVITDSRQSQKDILRFLPVDPGRLTSLPTGLAANFRPMPAGQVAERLRIRFGLSEPFLLFVGSAGPRKNLKRLIQAFTLLADSFPRHRLVLAGPQTAGQTKRIRGWLRTGLRDRILTTGPVSDSDLAFLYSGCALFVFPSLYEGFGMPPLEAMACGAPVVCSNTSSLPEVVGDAARQVDPLDVPAMADALREVLANSRLRGEMRRRGMKQSKSFTWDRNAEGTMAVYRKVVNH